MPHEVAWVVNMRSRKDEIESEEARFLLEYFTESDLTKLIKGQALSKKRLAEIQVLIDDDQIKG
jgi:hypothetical protein